MTSKRVISKLCKKKCKFVLYPRFLKGKLAISEFDYNPDERSFDFVEAQTESKVNTQNIVILSPSSPEFDQLNSRFFKTKSSFSLITE